MITKYIILSIYFLILFLIGYFASRRVKNLKDFYVGGKKLGYWVVAFSARATGESGWLLLGVTGMGAIMGFSAMWVVVGEVIGVAIAWMYLAKPFKKYTDEHGAITIPDYLASRFQTKTHTLRIISAAALAIFVTIFVSAQIDTTGKAFESFLGWDYFTGAIFGFIIVLAYTFSGGFVAVAWSDLFQGLIMLFGLVSLPIAVYFLMDMPAGGFIQGLKDIDPSLVTVWGEGGFTLMNVATALGLAGIGLGFLGSPQVFVRFMSIKDEKEIEKGTWVAIAFTLLTDTAAVMIGIIGRLAFTKSGDAVEQILGVSAENILPIMVDEFMPLFIIGIYIAAVLAAIMSTIDSLLVVASSAITRDFYQQIFRPDLIGQPMAKTSRMITLGIAALSLIVALIVASVVPGRTVFWFIIFGWSGIAATFCPMIILSLFWKGYNEAGAIASMLVGFFCIPIFKFLMPMIEGAGPYFVELAELQPSFWLSMLAGVLVSKWKSKKEIQA